VWGLKGVKMKKKKKSSQVPKYLELIEKLHELGYKIISFKDKSNSDIFDEKYTLTIFRSHS